MPDVSRTWRIGPIGWALLGFETLFAAYIILAPREDGQFKVIEDLGQLIIPAAACVLCWLAANHAGARRLQWSWRLFSLATALWFAAQVIWSYDELIAQLSSAQASSISIVIWLVCYLPAFLGLLLQLPRGRGLSDDMITTLDALLFTLAAAGLSWQLAVGPALGAGVSEGILSVADPWAYGDLLLVFGLISIFLRLPLRNVPVPTLYLLACGLLQVGVDVFLGSARLRGDHIMESWIDALTSLTLLLVCMAAIAAGALRKDIDSAEGNSTHGLATIDLGWLLGVRKLLPYLALVAAGVLFAWEFEEVTGSQSAFALGTAVALTALILFRQWITLVENKRLNASLTELSLELEARVAERTKELTEKTADLSASNRIATDLSLCMSSQEVLDVGLTLACEATRLPAGCIWVAKADGAPRIVAERNVPERERSVLVKGPTLFPAFAASVREGHPLLLTSVDLAGYDIGLSPTEVDGLPDLLLVPLLSRRQMLGAMGLLAHPGQRCCHVDLQLAQAIGSQLGVALENVRRYEEARFLADRDPVTRLLNHRALHQRLEQELKRAQRADLKVSIIMTDLDDFKLFNDVYGHPMGDQILRTVADVLTSHARDYDVVARYGGDEFAIVLPDTETEGAVAFARRLRESLSERPFTPPHGRPVPIHLSCGIATFPSGGQQGYELINAADANLLKAKQRGGDTIAAGELACGADDSDQAGSVGVYDGLITIVDNKDHYTRRHSQEVAHYALAIAQEIGCSEETQRALRNAALLHDLGKIGIPDQILRRPGPLQEHEKAVVRQHVALGLTIIKDLPDLETVLEAIGAHHERYDGLGYPYGLSGEEIPLLGRILAVADVYSAMTTDRPYHKGLTQKQAMEEMKRLSGTQLDGKLVQAFLDVLHSVGAVASESHAPSR